MGGNTLNPSDYLSKKNLPLVDEYTEYYRKNGPPNCGPGCSLGCNDPSECIVVKKG